MPEIIIFEVLRASGLFKELMTLARSQHLNYNITIKHATFICAINSIRKLVRLAQLVEQWTSNPEVGGIV